jgi:hypothetical protein
MNDGVPGRSFEEYFQDANTMREAYAVISKHVVALLMENL